MGRPSKLSEKEWLEIERRILAGEKPSALADEFKVSRAAVSRRVSKPAQAVKEVANQIVAAEAALRSLPVSQQGLAISLADELRQISAHLAGAARFGAATAHRLSGIAHAKVQEIDDAAPLDEESVGALKGVAVLTKMANDASSIALNLIAANKDTVAKMNEREPEKPAVDVTKLSDGTLLELLEARG